MASAGITKAKKNTAASKTLGKKMPPMQATPHESDQPGWCSNESKKLSAKAIAAGARALARQALLVRLDFERCGLDEVTPAGRWRAARRDAAKARALCRRH